MKYLHEERFIVQAGDKTSLKNYNDNYDRIFGEKQEEPPPAFPTHCEKCNRPIDDCNINWNAPREPVCVVCAHPISQKP